MAHPTNRRRYSAPELSATAPPSFLKDTPLSAARPLPRKPSKPAIVRLCNAAKLLDMVLKKLTPREAVGAQRVNKAFFRAVANNFNLQRRHIRCESDIFRRWHPRISWDDVGEIQATGLISWEEILGAQWESDVATPIQESRTISDQDPRSAGCTLVMGHVYGCFILDMQAAAIDPLAALSEQTWPQLLDIAHSGRHQSAFLSIRYGNPMASPHDRLKHRSLGGSGDYSTSITAEMNPDKDERWFELIRRLVRRSQAANDAFKYAEMNSITEKIRFNLNRCIVEDGDNLEDALVSNPVFEYLKH